MAAQVDFLGQECPQWPGMSMVHRKYSEEMPRKWQAALASLSDEIFGQQSFQVTPGATWHPPKCEGVCVVCAWLPKTLACYSFLLSHTSLSLPFS